MTIYREVEDPRPPPLLATTWFVVGLIIVAALAVFHVGLQVGYAGGVRAEQAPGCPVSRRAEWYCEISDRNGDGWVDVLYFPSKGVGGTILLNPADTGHRWRRPWERPLMTSEAHERLGYP